MTTKLQKIWKWKAASDSYDLFWPDEEETRLKIQKQAATKPEQGYYISAEQLKVLWHRGEDYSAYGYKYNSLEEVLKDLGVEDD